MALSTASPATSTSPSSGSYSCPPVFIMPRVCRASVLLRPGGFFLLLQCRLESAETERHRGLDEPTSPFSPADAGLTSADKARHAASRHRPLHGAPHISVSAHEPAPQQQRSSFTPAARGSVAFLLLWGEEAPSPVIPAEVLCHFEHSFLCHFERSREISAPPAPSSRRAAIGSYSNAYKISVGRSPEKTGHLPG